jgi:hypothetical protein
MLGWYNRITKFTADLIDDAKTGALTKKKINNYVRGLGEIRNSDTFHSNCRLFVGFKLKEYENKSPFHQTIVLEELGILMENLRLQYLTRKEK